MGTCPSLLVPVPGRLLSFIVEASNKHVSPDQLPGLYLYPSLFCSLALLMPGITEGIDLHPGGNPHLLQAIFPVLEGIDLCGYGRQYMLTHWLSSAIDSVICRDGAPVFATELEILLFWQLRETLLHKPFTVSGCRDKDKST